MSAVEREIERSRASAESRPGSCPRRIRKSSAQLPRPIGRMPFRATLGRRNADPADAAFSGQSAARLQALEWRGIGPGGSEPVPTIEIRDRATLFGIVRDPLVRFGDAYSEGRAEVHGDLVQALEEVYRSGRKAGAKSRCATPVGIDAAAPDAQHARGSRDNIHHHYDIGNEFYALWLGSTMAYTCAYYPTPDATLDAGADRQDGSRVSQAAAACRRDGGRGRLRLGRARRCTWRASTA